MNYFLAKSEPSTYSIDDLQREQSTVWDGVKNPTARIVMKSMVPGDRVFMYHSGECKIVGLFEITSLPRDSKEFPKRSTELDVKFVAKFEEVDQMSLKEIKSISELQNWELIRIGRLSVMKVPSEFLNLTKVQGILAKYI